MAAGDLSAVSSPAAAVASASAVSSPAPTTSTAAPSTPAPSAPAAAAPSAPSAPSGPNPGEGNIEYLQRVMLAKAGITDTGDQAPSDTVVPDLEQPEIPADGNQPEGESSPELEPATEPEVKADEGKPTEDDKPPEGEADDDALSLDEPDLLDPRSLAARLKENPELNAALEKAGLKNELFATARVATKASKIAGIFHNDPEVAQNAAEQAEKFGVLSEKFTHQQSLDDTQGLLRSIMEFDYELDDDGKTVMVKDAQGNEIPKASSGSVGRFIDNIFQIGLNFWRSKSDQAGNADLKAACEIFQSEYEKASGSAQPDYSHLDEETKARLEAADTREKQVATREAADRQRREQEFETGVTTGIETKVNDEVDKLLSTATLTEGQKKWARDQIKERVTGQLRNSRAFFNRLDVIMRRPMSEKTQQLRVSHAINSARPLLPKVAREVLGELGVQISAKREAQQARTAAQTQASRSEIRAAAQPAKPGAAMNAADVTRMAREELSKEGKDASNTTLMFQKVFEIKRRLGTK